MAMFDGIITDVAERFGLGAAARPLVQELLGLITEGPGGLAGFIEKLHASGFGRQVTAWLNRADGPGLSAGTLSGQNVEQLFGTAAISGIASRIGIARDVAGSTIGQILPRILATLAPGGILSGEAAAEAAALAGSLRPAAVVPP